MPKSTVLWDQPNGSRFVHVFFCSLSLSFSILLRSITIILTKLKTILFNYYKKEFKAKIISNTIMYVNCDTAIQGNIALAAKASPLLHGFLYDVAKTIQVAGSKQSVFERWLQNEPDKNNLSQPWINPNLGSSSDHTAFAQRAGVACMDIRLVRNNVKTKIIVSFLFLFLFCCQIIFFSFFFFYLSWLFCLFVKSVSTFKNLRGSYPMYHSSYETFNLVNSYVDPDFKVTRSYSLNFLRLCLIILFKKKFQITKQLKLEIRREIRGLVFKSRIILLAII